MINSNAESQYQVLTAGKILVDHGIKFNRSALNECETSEIVASYGRAT